MKIRPLICCAALFSPTAWAVEETTPSPAPVPESRPLARYAAMTEKSPFALATAAAPAAEPQASFAANWYVAGIARLGDTDFVTIKSRDASTQFSLFGREPQNGVSVASVEWSETIGKSKVILQKGTETAKLEFNEADLRGPAPAPNQANGAVPGKPGATGVPGVVVTPPGSNNAPRPSFPSRSASSNNAGTSAQPGVTMQPGGNVPPAVPQIGGQTGTVTNNGQPPAGGEVRRRIRVIGAPQ